MNLIWVPLSQPPPPPPTSPQFLLFFMVVCRLLQESPVKQPYVTHQRGLLTSPTFFTVFHGSLGYNAKHYCNAFKTISAVCKNGLWVEAYLYAAWVDVMILSRYWGMGSWLWECGSESESMRASGRGRGGGGEGEKRRVSRLRCVAGLLVRIPAKDPC